MSAPAAAREPSGAPAGPGPGRPRDPQVDHDVLEAAVHLLSSGGYEALSVEAVAARAGVSRATVYRRYANRADLLDAACRRFAKPDIEPPDTGSVRGDLIALVRRLAAMLNEDDTGGMLPAVLSAARAHAEVREALRRFISTRRSPSVEVIRRGVDRGEIRTDVDPELLADLLNGAVVYRLLIRNGSIGERRAADLVDTLLAGAGT